MGGVTLETLKVFIEAFAEGYYQEINKVQAETKKATAAVEKETGKIKEAFGKIGKAITAALSVAMIVKFAKSCIELGSALSEVQNVVDVTFGAMSGKINEFAQNAIEQFGLSETSAKKYTSTIGAMLKSMGFGTATAADMSMEMTGLAADMASFYNLDTDVAFQKIRSGISGETEPLKQLGINLSVANLQEYALSQGITKSYNAMTQQEQALLRYNYLLEVTKDAQGDFARTSDSWANQVRILTERFNALKAAIGQGLIAVLTPVIKALNQLLAKILAVTNAFSAMIAKLTGKKATKTTMQDVGDAGTGAAKSIDGAAGATDKLTKGMKKAGKAAKKAEEAYHGLISADEIHTLTKAMDDHDSAAAGAGGSGGGGGGGTAEAAVDAAEAADEELNPALERLLNRLKELWDLFKEGFKAGMGDVTLEPLKKAIEGIKKSLYDIFTDPGVLQAANNFADRTAYALGQVAGAAAAVAITVATNVVGGIDKYLAQNTDRIKQWLIDMFDISGDIAEITGNLAQAIANILSPLGGETGQQVTANLIGIFADAAMYVVELWLKTKRDIEDILATPIIVNQEGIKEALEGILEVLETVTGTIKELVDYAGENLNAMYDEHIRPLAESIRDGLSDLLGSILDFWNGNVKPLLDEWATKIDSMANSKIKPVIDSIIGLIASLADATKALWEGILKPFIDWVIADIAPTILPILDNIMTAVIEVFGYIAEAVGGLIDIIRGIIDFLVGVFTGDWEKAWSGIQEIAAGILHVLSGIVGTVMATIGGIISTVLNTISALVTTICTGIRSFIMTICNAIANVIKTFTSATKATISTGLNAIKTVWEQVWNSLKNTVITIFNSIWSAIKGVINSILGGIEAMCNGVIRGINTVTGALNNLSFDIPDWVPELGGKKFGFNIPSLGEVSLPRLAKGGIVSGATPLIAGEAGREAILPLENNTGWMDGFASRVAEILSVNMRMVMEDLDESERVVKTTVNLNGDTLVDQIDTVRKRRGYNTNPAMA